MNQKKIRNQTEWYKNAQKINIFLKECDSFSNLKPNLAA